MGVGVWGVAAAPPPPPSPAGSCRPHWRPRNSHSFLLFKAVEHPPHCPPAAALARHELPLLPPVCAAPTVAVPARHELPWRPMLAPPPPALSVVSGCRPYWRNRPRHDLSWLPPVLAPPPSS